MTTKEICPRCKNPMTKYPATSRRDNQTKICSRCGTDEAMFDFAMRSSSRSEEEKENAIKLEKEWLEGVKNE